MQKGKACAGRGRSWNDSEEDRPSSVSSGAWQYSPPTVSPVGEAGSYDKRLRPADEGACAEVDHLLCLWPNDDFDHFVGFLANLVCDNDDELLSIADVAEFFYDD
jgi:hypothetical protein